MPPAKRAATRPKAPPESELPGQPAAEYVATETLRPWVRNPRKNDDAVPGVMESIRKFGFGAPLLARRENGEIIAGHTRLKAALKLGLPVVPVRYRDLTEKQAHLLALADNKLGEKAVWDDAELLAILGEYGPSEVALAGWTDKDLAALERAAGKDKEIEEDVPPEPPTDPITKVGDLWQLGRHRLLCGDSTDRACVARLCAGRTVGLMATDPPYGVSVTGGTHDPRDPNYRKGAERKTIENDALVDEKLESFLRAAFAAALPALAPGAAWYVWLAGVHALWFIRAYEVLGGFRHQLVWVKPNFVFGRSDYHYKHEPCLYGWTPGAAHAWLGGAKQSSVFELSRDKEVAALTHPSVKPVELYAIQIRNHLGADGALIDPFAGSGPAFSAAEQLDRTCYGLELSPAYCDVIVERWQALTGQKATRGGTEGATPKPKGGKRPPAARAAAP